MNLQPFTSQIVNNAINTKLGSGGAGQTPIILANLIATLWRVLFTLGGLAVIIFMASGAMSWITAGGDKAKVEEARNRITQAVIGMLVLFSIIALVNFVFPVIGFDILAPKIENNL